MSLTRSPVAEPASRIAVAATEARRHAQTDRLVERLSLLILVGAMLYTLIGDRPFDRSGIDYSTDISPINRWVWLSLLVLTVPILWVRLLQVIELARAAWPMLLLYAWFLASTSWAIDPAASLRRVLLYVVILVIAFAVSTGLQRRHAAHLAMALCAGLVILVDLASWPVVPGIAMTDLGFAGMHAQKNVTGEIALFAGLANATCLRFARGRDLRIVLGTMLAAAVVVLVVSRSTTSLVLGLGILVVAPAVTRTLRGSPAGIAVVAFLVLLVPAFCLFSYLAWAGLSGQDPWAPLSGVTFTERTDLWQFLIENIRQRPLLGCGFGSFWAIDPALQPSILSGLWFGQGHDVANQGHDAYLDIAATTGLVGLALAVFVLGRAIVVAARIVRWGGSAFPLAFLLIVTVHSVTESSLFTANSAFGSFFVLLAIQVEWVGLGLERKKL